MDRTKELLINLCCPTLTHFRWYKDVFLSKIVMKSEGNSVFWKEQFIFGLPSLFGEKVRIRLRNKHGGLNNPYESYTYGELINK